MKDFWFGSFHDFQTYLKVLILRRTSHKILFSAHPSSLSRSWPLVQQQPIMGTVPIKENAFTCHTITLLKTLQCSYRLLQHLLAKQLKNHFTPPKLQPISIVLLCYINIRWMKYVDTLKKILKLLNFMSYYILLLCPTFSTSNWSY